ncbi:unnamed protein product [Bathycoccus prasinos]
MVDREHLESEAAFYRELQNIRSEVGECENRIAILNEIQQLGSYGPLKKLLVYKVRLTRVPNQYM